MARRRKREAIAFELRVCDFTGHANCDSAAHNTTIDRSSSIEPISGAVCEARRKNLRDPLAIVGKNITGKETRVQGRSKKERNERISS